MASDDRWTGECASCPKCGNAWSPVDVPCPFCKNAELRAAIDEHIKTRREALTLLNEGSTDAAIQCLLRAAIGKGEA